MAENFDFPAPDERPHAPGSGTTGDFPADFFEDEVNSSTGHMPETGHEFGVGLGAASAHEPMHASAPDAGLVLDEPPPRTPTNYTLPTEPPPAAPVFPIVMGILFAGTLVAAVLVGIRGSEEVKSAAAPAPAAASPAPAEPVASATPAASDATAGEVKALKEGLDKVTAQLKDLSAKVDGLPKSSTEPDLKPVHEKIDGLAKNVAVVAVVSAKLEKLDGRVGSIDDSVKATGDKLSALSAEVKKASDAASKAEAVAAKATEAAAKPAAVAATTETTAAKPEDASGDKAMTQGTDLFKAAKYKEADDVFKKLVATGPKDARPYYYAAFTNGLTTNDWQNETLKIATKGAELEKSGATKPADVDAAFAGLSDNLKPWLAHFRGLAK